MSISVQLEASNDHVVSYLKKLWNNPIVSSSVNEKEEKSLGSTQSQPQTQSIIQQLIDAKIINSAVWENVCENSSEPKNINNTDTTNTTNCDESLPVPKERDESIESTQSTLSTLDKTESQEKSNVNLIQSDYIEISGEKPLDPIKIQLEISTENQEIVTCSNADCLTNSSDMQVGQVEQTEQVEQIELDTGDKTKFRKQVKDNLSKIREIGFRVYHNVGLEKEVNLVTSTVTSNDINKVFDFKTGTAFTRKSLMGDVSRCIIFPKYKSGDPTKPENFRYLVNHHNTVKILDRIWCSELITKCGTNLPDRTIYKSTLVKAFNGSIITTASENTKSFDNVVMIDIMKAFDSLDWDILEDLLMSNLTRKTNKETAGELVTQYMTILKNRELYYNNIRVEVSKGIPTGLPSSNLVFTLGIEEILFRWFAKSGYSNNKDFKLNVYVDDIYMKITNVTNASEIVNGLITHLENFKLNVNKDKTKADKRLNISGLSNYIEPSDYYLGIPFTRDVKLYGQLILAELNKKHNVTWLNVFDILSEEESSIEKSSIYGFLNYKLRPFFENTVNDNKEFNSEFIKNFVYEHYAKEPVKQRDTRIKQLQQVLITIVVVLSAISIAIFNSSGNSNLSTN